MNVNALGPKPEEVSIESVNHATPEDVGHVDSYEVEEIQLFCDMGPLDTPI